MRARPGELDGRNGKQVIAKGAVARTFGVSVEEAFTMLRKRARDSRRRLTDVAQEVVVGDGRDFATPDDVKAMVLPVLRHRVLLTPEAVVDGRGTDAWVLDVVETVEAPRDR